MPNLLNADGLQVASVTELVSDLTTALQGVFGADINTGSNTPDGQLINIFAQVIVDMLETLVDVYNIFFVDAAYGVALDQLVAINGLARKAGSYTQVYVQVTTTQALTLPGQNTSTPFTVADAAGNQYQLVSSYVFAGAGTVTLLFQAVLQGQLQVTANTITSIVTTTQGVSSVNNPAFTTTQTGTVTSGSSNVTGLTSTTGMTPGMALTDADSFFPPGTTVLSIASMTAIVASANATGGAPTSENVTVATPATIPGTTEETDVQLKIRRAQSFNLQTVGPAASIRAALLNLADVADAYVAENDTAAPVSGVPANGVWVIVNGGTAEEIGTAIAATKAPGCAMTGAQTYNVPLPQGNTFLAKWDNATPVNIYVRATLNPRLAGETFDTAADAVALAAALVYKLGQNASIGDVILAMASIEPNAVLSTVNVSFDNSTWEDILTPASYQDYFVVPAANITLTFA
jgi:hypothetical protein